MSARRLVTAALTASVAAGSLLLPASADATPNPEPKIVMVGVRISPHSAFRSPWSKNKYGVGQLVTMRFDAPVTRREDVERAIRISSGKELPAGAWGWVNSTTAVYRPKRFWPANARIQFTTDFENLVLARQDGVVYVAEERKEPYVLRTARRFVMTIKDSTHHMTVERNGKTIRRFGVSLGKRGWETRSGIKILTDERYARLRMTGYDPGKDESWDVIAPYSIRLTPSGEFIHGAPWANHRIGKWDGSHGCTNMFVRDARWLFEKTRQGDPVVTTGTGRPMQVTNGTPGSYWNYSWGDWKRLSGRFGKKPAAQARAMTLPTPLVDAGP
ncbi:MAG: L,D-transpeptidase [Candidatus Nanopelagicales bacterium]